MVACQWPPAGLTIPLVTDTPLFLAIGILSAMVLLGILLNLVSNNRI
jgi:hypothetical protein